MRYDFQVCPSCGDEFTLSILECSECRVALVSPDSLPPQPEPENFPPVAGLECVRVGPLPWTRALSDALTQAGLAHRVEPDTRSVAEGGIDPKRFGGETLYGSWVRSQDLEPAQEIDKAIFAVFEAEAAPVAGDSEACPACDTALAPDTLECTDCGLVFG